MTRRTLGSSDLAVFPLCLGGNVFGWSSDVPQSEAVLDAYAAGGGNFIDTADSYSAWKPGNVGGESEAIIGAWMAARGNRADMIVATKVGKLRSRPGLSAENIRLAADESLGRLQTDSIDLYFTHTDDATVALDETVEALDALVRAGKVRAIGLSNYTPERVSEYVSVARANGWTVPVALQPHYNLVYRAEFEASLAALCAQLDMGVAPYFGLGAGLLTGKYVTADDMTGQVRAAAAGVYVSDQAWQVVAAVREIAAGHGVAPATVALEWLRDQPTITAPIASARVVEQLPVLMATATFALPGGDAARLTALSSGL